MIPLLENLINDYNEIKDLLLLHAELSLQTSVESHFRKTFLLSCASYYETKIQELLRKYLSENSEDDRVVCFATNKGIQRQYHTYFQWDSKNVNSFLGLFGSNFKEVVCAEIRGDEKLTSSMIAFLIIGNERNKMVHENFLEYNLEKTFNEIVELNKLAIHFVEYLESKFT